MRISRWLRIMAVVPVSVALSTCGHDTSGPPPPPTPAAMAVVSGGGQTAIAGQALAERLFVLVTSASGVPVPGVRVQWAVTAGSGSVTSASVNTDGQGKASVAWTLGVRAGQPQTATASVTGLSGSPVTFSATAIPGPPASVTLSAGDSQTVIAGSAVTTKPAVVVKDINANPVPAVAVTFAVATGGGAVTGAGATTDAGGIAAVGSWTSGTVAGKNTMTATVAALPAYTFTSTGVAGPPASVVVSAGNNQTAVAGATVATAPAVLVKDVNANPTPNVAVAFAVTAGSGTLVGGGATTGANGVATVTSWRLGNAAGPNTLAATVTGTALAAVPFAATGVAGAAATVTPSAGTGQSATVNTAVATAPAVVVKDANGNVVAGVGVTFAVASGGGALTAGGATTDANGIAVVGSWTLGTAAGANTLTATVTGLTAATFTSTGTAGPAATVAPSAGNGQSAVAGQVVVTAPAAVVKDAFGNPVAGVTVTFAVASGGGALGGSATATTNAAGVAQSGSWTLGTTAGANTVTATVTGLSATTFTATGTAGAPTSLAVSVGGGQSAVAGSTVATAPSVVVRDANGNGVPGVTVTFAVLSGGGSVTGSPVATDANGVAQVGSWTLGTTVGNNGLGATVPGLTAVNFSATGIPGPPATVTSFAGGGQSVTAGSSVTVNPAVSVRDANGNAVAGVSVVFAVTAGGGAVGGANATTGPTGIASVTGWQLGTLAGTNTVTATVSGLPPVTFSASGTPGSPATVEILAGDGLSATVGASLSPTPAVIVRDANGNAVPGATVTFAVVTGGGTTAGDIITADASGVATLGSWVLGSVAGTNTLTATVSGISLTFTATGTVTAAAAVDVSAGNNQSATVNAAVATAPAVVVRDAFGNPKPGVAVTFAVASGGGGVTGASATTDANGVASASGWTLGTAVGVNTLTASVAGLPAAVFTATGTADAAASVAALTGNGQSAVAGAAVAIAPEVVVRDQFGNPVAGVAVTFAVSSGLGSVAGDAATTNGSGIARLVTWTLGAVAGPNSLTVTVAGGGIAGNPVTFAATGLSGSPGTLVVTAGDGQTATVGTAVATPPAVVLKDANSNPIVGATVTFLVTLGGGSVADGSAITDNNGVAAVVSWTLGNTAGANALTATVNGLVVSFGATGTPGVPATITKTAGDLQSATVGAAVATLPSVTVRDATGNAVSGIVVTFTAATGGGVVVTGAAATTNASGVARVDSWTLGATAGTNTLTAGVSGTTTQTFTATGTAGAPTTMTVNDGAGQSATAGTPVSTKPSVVLRDGSNNPVPNIAVSFAVVTGGGGVTGGAATTDGSGVARVGSWTLGNLVGANTLEAVSSGLTPVTFSATGLVGAAASIAISAGNGQVGTVLTTLAAPPQVVVRDLRGNPVPGVDVVFTTGAASGSISPASPATVVTDGAGLASVIWTLGAAADTDTVTASIGAGTVTFLATAVSGSPSTISKDPATDGQGALVNALVASPPSVTVRDATNNPIQNAQITFTALSGNGTVVGSQPVLTDVNGVATVGGWQLGTVVGTNRLTASSPGLSPVVFTATVLVGAADNVAIVAGNNQGAAAGTAVAVRPSVVVRDQFGNVVPGENVTFAVTAGSGSISGPATVATDPNGIARVGGWTLGAIAGGNTLTATVGALPIATFTATATPGGAATVTVSAGDGQTAVAGSAVATAPSVVVTDALGNVVPNASVTFAVVTGGGVTGAGAVTDANGVATAGTWTLDSTAGTNELTATVAGVAPAVFTATGTAGSPASVAVSAGNNQTAVAGAAVAAGPTVLVRDANDNPVPGATVSWTVTGGGGSRSAATSLTDVAGLATITWTLGTTAGANTLSAAVGGGGSAGFTATGVAGGPASVALSAGNAQSAPVNAAVVTPPAVLVRDANSNPVPNATVTFAVASGGGAITGAVATTNSAGIVAVGSWTLGTIVGANALTATATGSGITGNPVSFTATGTPGPPATITVSAGDNQSATVNTTVATLPAAIVRDQFGNVVPGVAVGFAVTSGAGSLTGPTTTTSASGVAAVGSWKLGVVAGTNTLAARVTGIAALTFGAIGTAGAPTSVAVAAGNNQIELAGQPLSIAPAVVVRDQFSNPVSGVTVSFQIGLGGGVLLGPISVTNTAGIAQVQRWTLGPSGGGQRLDVLVATLPTVGITATAAAGLLQSCGIRSDGVALCWGRNSQGQLGDGTLTDRNTPATVVGGQNFTGITIGGAHTCALTTAGAVYCWGGGLSGQLGDGTFSQRSPSPTAVTGGLTFISVSNGFQHSCGLTSDGSAYCWGRNNFGQLGDSGTVDRDSPTVVAGGRSYTAIAAGAYHTCALAVDGTVYCWGNGIYGQLGIGVNTAVNVPTAVAANGQPFTGVAAGGGHSCGAQASGAVYCWGNNFFGQLGDGTTASRQTPVLVSGGATFTSIAAGYYDTCGVTTAGATRCWGRNDFGQLGDGTTLNAPAPTLVAGGNTFAGFIFGAFHTCGRTAAGATFCWGDNTLGQIGDGTFVRRLTPVPVIP